MAIEEMGGGLTEADVQKRLATWEAERQTNRAMPHDQFVERFKAHMVANAGFEKFDDGMAVADYAAEIAESYYEDIDQRQDGPEECADSDISYWGED